MHAPRVLAMANASHPGLAALACPDRRIILGSASPARRAVLADLAAQHGEALFAFSVLTADLDEKALGSAARAAGDAATLVLELAAAKADALADALDAQADAEPCPALLITADQVVVLGGAGGEIREKPVGAAQAAAWLAEYRTCPPSTVSGLAVTAWPSRRRATGVHTATILFTPGGVPDAHLAAAGAAALGCAGGLRVEGPAAPFIAELRGGRDSVFGLPTGLLLDLAAEVDGGVSESE